MKSFVMPNMLNLTGLEGGRFGILDVDNKLLGILKPGDTVVIIDKHAGIEHEKGCRLRDPRLEIRDWIEWKGYKQYEVAKEIDVDRPYLTNVLNRARSLARPLAYKLLDIGAPVCMACVDIYRAAGDGKYKRKEKRV